MVPGRIDSDEFDVEVVPLNNRGIFQRNLSVPSSPEEHTIDDNARTLGNSHRVPNSSSKRQITILQFITQSRVLWVLGPECFLSWLFIMFGTMTPLQWQKNQCSSFLADRPPPFQLLSSGDLVLDPSLNYPLESSQISSK